MIDTRLRTLREAATVAAVTTHYAEHGRPPTYKEVGHRLGVRKSRADQLVKACVGLGSLIVIRRRGVRTEIRLATPLAEISTADLVAEVERRHRSEIVPATGNNLETSPIRLAA
jgi:DNA-binding IscR family transcriptional regulator